MSDETPVPSDEAAGASEAPKPILRVVKGDLTAEELAALVAVIAARNAAASNAAARAKPRVRSEWGHPAHLVRKPHRVGSDQWRRSTFGS
ncbi:MAG: hypothetical protein JWQ70_2690 [Aeromicrobium sp.]|nr:hypothetical protein [Aeromicrobium sp.]